MASGPYDTNAIASSDSAASPPDHGKPMPIIVAGGFVRLGARNSSRH